MMDFQELLRNRRAIRDFQDKPVPLGVIQEIIQDTTLAPTASNGQPCKFVIIRDRAVIKRISDESKANLLDDLARHPESPLQMYAEVLRDATFNAFYNAPCLVLLFGPEDARFLDIDCALTAAYFMFAAAARGLGTCWIALGMNIRSHQLLAELGIPADCRIVTPLILGYPTIIPPVPERHAPEIVKIIT